MLIFTHCRLAPTLYLSLSYHLFRLAGAELHVGICNGHRLGSGHGHASVSKHGHRWQVHGPIEWRIVHK